MLELFVLVGLGVTSSFGVGWGVLVGAVVAVGGIGVLVGRGVSVGSRVFVGGIAVWVGTRVAVGGAEVKVEVWGSVKMTVGVG